MPHEPGEFAPDRRTMFCRGCDYALDGLDSGVCPECGRGFDPQDVSTYRLLPNHILFEDAVCLAHLRADEAAVLCARLEAHGIPAAMHEERGGVIALNEVARGSVWVERSDLAEARALMHTPLPAANLAPWTCSGCSERIEGQFAMCWNCGTERPS